MTSLADRLAAASRDRATTAPATTDAMSGMSERRVFLSGPRPGRPSVGARDGAPSIDEQEVP